PDNSTIVKDFLKLSDSSAALMCSQICLSTNESGIQAVPSVLAAEGSRSQFVRHGGSKRLQRPRRIPSIQRELGADGWQVVELHGRAFGESLVQLLDQG